MRIFFLLSCLALFSLCVEAQQFSNPGNEEQACGFDEHHAWLMKTNPAYKARFIQQKAVLDSIKHAPINPLRNSRQIYTIPVVVHVIHLGDPIGFKTNISEQQILHAIDGLNERYANANGEGADIGINFCLANRDPNGCPTSGIIRVDGSSVPRYREEGISWADNCGADEHAVKDLSKWPTWQYYNIWVVHDICGDIAGYAYYPNGGEYDGTVIDDNSMKYEIGTLAHELGHGLNLKHTFSGSDNGCPANDDCMEDGDEICDTPPHRVGDCNSANPCSSQGDWLKSKNNWMSYCHPPYELGLFTEDQKTRILDAISVNPRAALLESNACANEERLQITSESKIMCPGDGRLLSAVPTGGFFVIAEGSGYIQNNVLTPTGGSGIVVEYILSEEPCLASVQQYIPIKLVPNTLLRSEEDSLCIGQHTLLQGFPAGGAYSVISGPGVIDSNMVIAEDAGLISLLYEKSQNGCLIRDTHVVTSFELPAASIHFIADDVMTAVPDTGSFQWLRCDHDFEIIPGATAPVFQPSVAGEYAVVATNGICRDTSDCVLVEVTTTRDRQLQNIQLYPNPVSDVFYLDGLSDPSLVNVIITDARGIMMPFYLVPAPGKIGIDISSFMEGVYIVQLEIKGVGTMVYKVVKV
ncbi:MAG TPA: zinc-dependent metalloprotease [Saprospiraceae bacterium]|nr:zinc-dependent metalloprotease [Saprospiraceae bacterium]